MSHCNAAEMDHGRNPVGNDSNTSSSRIGIELQHNHVAADIATKSLNTESKAAPFTATSTQRYCNLFSVQNNGISSKSTTALNASKTNRRQETTIVQSQNNTAIPAANVAANPKKARQRLRKGKWTIEEEEYTSRTIQYFSTGLLTLPDGATLRSYLAEKLNCDPMRITKKFTGACCLGRRAYHLRDRPRSSPTEIEMASFELLHLEQRFRLRVEHEQTGLPLPPRHELLASQPPAAVVSDVFPSLFSLQQGASSVKATNPWLQNPVIVPNPGQPSFIPGLAGIIPNVTAPGAGINLNAPNSSFLLAAGQLLLQNPSERTQTGNPAAAAAAPLQMLNNIVASLAFSQALNQQAGISPLQPAGSNISPSSSAAATTISSNCAPPTSTFNFNAPNITANVNRKSPPILIPIPIPIPVVVSQEQRPEKVQLYQQLQKKNLSSSTAVISKKEEHTKKLKAAFEEQQRALRLAYEKSLQDAQEREEQSFSSDLPAVTSDPTGRKPTTSANCTSSNFKISPDTASPAEQLQRSYEAHLAFLQRAEQQASFKNSSKSAPPASSASVPASRIEVGGNKTERVKTKEAEKSIKEKTLDEEEAGTILLGFLNSLRESYEDAVESKCGSKGTKQRHGYASKINNVAAAIPMTESISTARIESSTVMTELSLDSSNRNLARRNNNNHGHSHVSINSRRQTSDPITSLSHFQTSKQMVKPASVTETSSSTSSQPTIEQSSSSQEDSKSDKMGHSSSEESEKEITASRRMSRGPPRKRMKGFHEPHEFTRENLMAHSKRMDRECEESGDASSSDE